MLAWPNLALRCLWLLSAHTAVAGDVGSTEPPVDPMSMVVVDLEVTGDVVVRKEVRPRAFVTNLGSQPVTLFHTGDGSGRRWRPSYSEYVVDGIRQRSFRARCGNRNGLGPRDVLTLGPGERAELRLDFIDGQTFLEPGQHDLQLVLSHDPAARIGGGPLRKDDPTVLELIARTPAYRIVSRPLVVEVQPIRARTTAIVELITRRSAVDVVRELRWILQTRRLQKDRPLSKVESDTLLALEFLDDVEQRELAGYFWHERANQHDEIVRALRAIGAAADADALDEWVRNFPGGALPRDVEARQSVLDTDSGRTWCQSLRTGLSTSSESSNRLALVDAIATSFRTHVDEFADP